MSFIEWTFGDELLTDLTFFMDKGRILLLKNVGTHNTGYYSCTGRVGILNMVYKERAELLVLGRLHSNNNFTYKILFQKCY